MKSNWALQGEIGTGKTRALKTLLPTFIDEAGRECEGSGLETFLISLEPGAAATLGPNMCGGGIGDAVHRIHIKYIPTVAVGFDVLSQYIELANRVPIKTLLDTVDPNKRNYRQALEICDATAEFICDGCGENFGAVREWGEDRCIAIDSLTGLTKAFTQNLVGGKPIRSLPEIGVIMEFIESFLDAWWGNTKCSAGLIAHVDREVDPLSGASRLTLHTIGQKLAPRLVKKPDEVITAHFADGDYYWSTQPEQGSEVQKRRRLPYSERLPADFRQIYKNEE